MHPKLQYQRRIQSGPKTCDKFIMGTKAPFHKAAAEKVTLRAMYFDANLPDFKQASINCDVAIVGAGPAGITLAQQFKNTSFQVCLLESGGFEANEKAQQLSFGSLNSPSAAIEADYVAQHSQRLFGGTGSVWGGYCREMDALDFEQRDLPFAHAWPITKEDLQPYYPWSALKQEHNTAPVSNNGLDIKY